MYVNNSLLLPSFTFSCRQKEQYREVKELVHGYRASKMMKSECASGGGAPALNF
jgi:hypothetical protein